MMEKKVPDGKGFLSKLSEIGKKAGLLEDVPARASVDTKAQTPSVTVNQSAPKTNVLPDQSIVSRLGELLQNHLPPVYATFMEKYEDLKDIIPDETTRFRAALKTSKANTDQLLTAMDDMVKVLDSARDSFERDWKQNRERILGDLQKSIASHDEAMHSMETQISELQKELATRQSVVNEAGARILSETDRLNRIHDGFSAAHSQVAGQIISQKSRISSMSKA